MGRTLPGQAMDQRKAELMDVALESLAARAALGAGSAQGNSPNGSIFR